MMIDLTVADVEVLTVSLQYSQRAVREAEGTPYSQRQDKLRALDKVVTKLRDARGASKSADHA
jgi:hypothetical protein